MLIAGAAHAQNAQRGQKLFEECAACHSTERGVNGVGPSLAGTLGRKAGEGPEFRYSPALRRSGITWSAEKLNEFIADPQQASARLLTEIMRDIARSHVWVAPTTDRALKIAETCDPQLIVVEVGQEEGRIIQPGGFDSTPEGSFVVADVPRGQERLQIFGPSALRTTASAGSTIPSCVRGRRSSTVTGAPTEIPSGGAGRRKFSGTAP